MSRPRLLDLFCKAGGAAMGYHSAGFDVVGVDIEPQPNYPFEFHQMDAMQVLRSFAAAGPIKTLDAIHASPPCPAYSSLGSRYDRSKHPDLVAPTRELLVQVGLPWVIENVVGAPLRTTFMLCGSSFGLGVRRHRLFETSFLAMNPPACDHASQKPKYRVYEHGKWFLSPVARVYGHGGGKANEQWAEAMGIDWMTRPELAQAIPPTYTEWIGGHLMEAVRGS